MNKNTPTEPAISGRRRAAALLAEPGHRATKPAAPIRVVATVGKVGVLALALASSAGCRSGDENALSVVITLPEQHVPLATKATLVVDYAQTGARLISEGGAPACTFTLPGVDGEFSDDRQGTLTIRASGPRVTRGPADIAACRMKAGDKTATAADLASRLTVRVESAEDAAGKRIDLAASASATRNGGGGGAGDARPSEDDVEQAQAKAVKAADLITKAVREKAAASRAATGAARIGETSAASTGGPGANHAAPGAATPPRAAAQPASPSNIAWAGGADAPGGFAPEVVDDSAMPGGDRDPGYDDSPADDDSVSSYSLDFFVQTPGTLSALQLNVTHLGNSGGFIGRGGDVDCVSLNTGALAASNYVGERLTRMGIVSLDGIRTPAKVMRCGFRTRENLSPGSFHIEVKDAADTESNQIEPSPTVFISAITPRR